MEDQSNPTKQRIESIQADSIYNLDLNGSATDISIVDNTAYVAMDPAGISVIDSLGFIGIRDTIEYSTELEKSTVELLAKQYDDILYYPVDTIVEYGEDSIVNFIPVIINDSTFKDLDPNFLIIDTD